MAAVAAATSRRGPGRAALALTLSLLVLPPWVTASAAPAPGAAPPVAAATAAVARVVSPALTVQPLDTPPAGSPSQATLRSLKGAIVSFQIELNGTGGGALSGVDVVPAALSGPGGAIIPVSDVRVYAEQYTRVWTPSDLESIDQDGTGVPPAQGSQKGWCALFPAGPAGSCGVPTDTTVQGVPFNDTWHCGGSVAPVVDVRRCLFPDALVPRVDEWFGQQRNAFPFTVPAGENRTVWVDVVVPTTAAAGTWTGAVTVTSTGNPAVQVPVSLTVEPFTMPAVGGDPELVLSSGMLGSPNTYCAAMSCGGKSADEVFRTYSLFVRSALENRLPLATVAPFTPGAGPGRTAFDRWMRPFLAGTGPSAAIGGVSPPALPARQRLVLGDTNLDQAGWAAWGDALLDAGAAGTMRYYCDEVLGDEASFDTFCQDQYAAAATPGWPAGAGTLETFLVGNQQQWSSAQGYGSAVTNSDTLVTNTYFLHLRNGTNQRPSYDAPPDGYLTTPGRRLWGYDSDNADGGVGGTPGEGDWSISPAYNGYPIIGGVDQPATSELATGLMSWAYRLPGYFYYDAFSHLPWAWNDCSTGATCLYKEGGHGDGTMFYPGTPAQLARPGTTVEPIPVESLRLKRFRDGSQDYSLIRLLETGCGGGCTQRSRAQLAAIVGGPDGGGAGAMPVMSTTSIGSAAYDAMLDRLYGLLSPTAPPTSRIAFTRGAGNASEIWTMAADGTGPRRLTNDGVSDDSATWSPDGTRIAYTHGADVWVMNADGTGKTNLTHNTGTQTASKPAWAPSGRKIVYVELTAGESHTDLYTVGANGTGRTALVTYAAGGIDSYDPSVSPTKVVYFTQGRHDGSGARLMRIGLDGQGIATVSSGSTDEAVDAAPAGGRITFSRSNPAGSSPYRLITSSGTGTNRVNVSAAMGAPSTVSQFQSSYGPDGTRLAYASTQGGDTEIWTVAADGSGPVQLTSNSVSDTNPDWGPAH